MSNRPKVTYSKFRDGFYGGLFGSVLGIYILLVFTMGTMSRTAEAAVNLFLILIPIDVIGLIFIQWHYYKPIRLRTPIFLTAFTLAAVVQVVLYFLMKTYL